MNVTRTRHPEIRAIRTATQIIELCEGQVFYRTPKAYEVWQEQPSLRRLARYPLSRVYWIHER